MPRKTSRSGGRSLLLLPVESDLERKFAFMLRVLNVPTPEREFIFSERKYRFDFAWPNIMLAIEIEGGIWSHGRHLQPQGYQNDCEKYNLAAIHGWTILRFTADMLDDGTALNHLETILKARGAA